MADSNFLLRFIADLSQVEREMAALNAKGKAMSREQVGATRSGKLAGVPTATEISGMTPGEAGRAKGIAVATAKYLGTIEGGLKNASQIAQNITASFAGKMAQDPKAFTAAASNAAGNTTRALRGKGLGFDTAAATADEAYARATQVLAGQATTKAAKSAAAGEQVTAAELAEARALREKARQTNVAAAKKAAAEDEAVIAAKADALASRKLSDVKIRAQAAAELLQNEEYARTRSKAAERVGYDRLVDKRGANNFAQANVGAIAAEAARTSTIRASAKIESLKLGMDQQSLRIKAESIVAEELYQRELNKSIKVVAQENNLRYHQGRTPGSRGGFQNGILGVNFVQGLKSTIQYGLPGAALYGTVAGIKSIVSEATELEVQLGILESQFNSAVDAGANFGDMTFDDLKSQIIDVSKTSLASADVVASVTAQLAGAFASDTGVPDFARALQEANDALQLSAVTDLPDQEITDSITAIQLAFENSLPSVAAFRDLVTGTSNQFGVLTPEIIKFTADLAPLAAEMGFTAQQLVGISAVAQRASGKSGAVLAEQLGRILPSLQEAQVELLSILNATTDGQEVATRIAAAFGAGDMPTVIRELSGFYEELNSKQKDAIASIVGGRREAGTFFALLSDNAGLSRVLGEGFGEGAGFEGSFAKKWADYSQSVEASMKKLQRAFETFGLALFEAGLDDAINTVISAVTGLVRAFSELIKLFGSINDFFGGAPGHLALLAAGYLAAAKAVNTLRNAELLANAARLLGAKSAGAAGIAAKGAPLVVPGGGLGGAGGGVIGAATGGGGGLARLMGFLNNGATAGGRFIGQGGSALSVGSGIGSAALSVAAFAAAGIAVDQAIQAFSDMRSGIQASGKNLEEIAAEQYRKGMSEEEILKIARQGAGSGVSGVVNDIGNFFSGSKGPEGTVRDAIQKVQAERQQTILERILKSDSFGDVNSRDVGLYRLGGGGDVRPLEGRELVEHIKQGLAKDPTSDYFNEAAAKLAERYPEIAEAVDLQIAHAKDVDESVARNQKSLDSATQKAADSFVTIDQSRIDFEQGRISRETFLSRLKEHQRVLEIQIKAAEDAGSADQKMLDEAQQIQQEINQTTRDGLQRALRAQKLITELTGGIGSSVDAANIDVDIAKVAYDTATGPEEKLEAAQEVLEAQRDAFQAWVESAETNDERLRRLGEGFELDPAALATVRAAALSTNPEIQRIAQDYDLAAGDLAGLVIDSINGYNQYSMEIIRSTIIAAAEIKKAALGTRTIWGYTFNTGTATDEDRAAIDSKLQSDLEALDQITSNASKQATRGVASERDKGADTKNSARDLAQAKLDYALALVENDPVKAAEIARQQADVAFQYAEDAAGRIQAEADRVRADRSYEEAIQAIAQGRYDLLIAIADAAGNEAQSAQIALDKARDNLSFLQSQGAGTEAIQSAQAGVVTAQAAAIQAALDEQLENFEFGIEMGQISNAQYAAWLESVIAGAEQFGLNNDQVRDLQRKLKDLKSDLSGDFQYNLPTDIALPTLYEVRRSGQTPGGSSNYQDNRIISIQLNANNPADAALAAQLIIDELNRPSRFGSTAISMY